MKNLSKRGYEFSFTWIFTIFVGAAVIFFAIFFAFQLVGTKQAERESAEGKSLGILLTPVETQTEQSRFSKIILSDETKISLGCEPPESFNPLGSQTLQLSIKPAFQGRRENLDSANITFHNKYIFANSNVVDGKDEIYVLAKPLYLPFKTADLLIMWSDKEKFCFKDLNNFPREFREEIEDLNMTNILIETASSPCNQEEHEVICLSRTTGCEITVDTNRNIVRKYGKSLYYARSAEQDSYAMLYAAIFSSPENYNCQVRRLMAHTSKLTEIYLEKSRKIQAKTRTGCSQELQGDLELYRDSTLQASQAVGTETSLALLTNRIQQQSISLRQLNGVISCELF